MELTRYDSMHLEKNLNHLKIQNRQKESTIIDAYKYVFMRKNDWTGPLNYYRNLPFYRIKDGEILRCPCLIITGKY